MATGTGKTLTVGCYHALHGTAASVFVIVDRLEWKTSQEAFIEYLAAIYTSVL
jgi:hypothetical protein